MIDRSVYKLCCLNITEAHVAAIFCSRRLRSFKIVASIDSVLCLAATVVLCVCVVHHIVHTVVYTDTLAFHSYSLQLCPKIIMNILVALTITIPTARLPRELCVSVCKLENSTTKSSYR